jgi:hypothetical protein
MTFKTFNIPWIWGLAMFPITAISIWIDRKWIAPGELLAGSKANPEWREVRGWVKEIRDKINAR